MFGIDSSELLMIAFVALIVIGPKDLPKAMRVVGYWVGRARGVGRQFRAGFDEMVRESELAEMEKKWAAENARIMREHSPAVTSHDTSSLSNAHEVTDNATGAYHAAEQANFRDANLANDDAVQHQPAMVEKPQVAPAPLTDTDAGNSASYSKAPS